MTTDWSQFEPVTSNATSTKRGGVDWGQFEPVKPDDTGDTMRGVKVALGQTVPILKGVAGLVGATAENTFGEGGISTAVKNWGLKGYTEGMDKLQPLQRDTDELTTAWDKAKEGDLGALVDWLQYGVGYAIGQGGEAVAMSLVGGAIGGAVGGAATAGAGAAPGAAGGAVAGLVAKGAVKEAAEGLIRKAVSREAAKLVSESAGQMTAEQAVKQATKTIASNIGSTATMLGYGGAQELGSIYPEAEAEAAKNGTKLGGADLARIWGSGLAAGGIEGLTDKLGVDAALGKLKFPGGSSRIGGALKAGAAGVAVEGTTEGIQTGIERYGANQEILSDEGVKDIINSAGLGAVGGAAIGGGIGLFHGQQAEAAKQSDEAMDRLANAGNIDEALQAFQETHVPLVAPPAEGPAIDEQGAMARLERESQAAGGDFSMVRGDDGVMTVGRNPNAVGATPQPAPVATQPSIAELPPEPFAARLATVREQLQDSRVRQQVRDQLGAEALNDILYYSQRADDDKLPGKTSDNMLSMAEQMLNRAQVAPTPNQRKLAEKQAAQQAKLGVNPAPKQIGLDTTPTGTIRVDSQGQAAPEVRADQISLADRARAMQDRRVDGMTGQTPRDTVRGAAPGVMVGEGTGTSATFPARAAPETRALPSPIDEAAHAAAPSPENDRPEPTQAQKEAGNYAKGHVTINGLQVSVENPQGSERSGVDRDGKAWTNTLNHHYGYFKGTVGMDGEHIDTFIKPGTQPDNAGPVFVIDQIHPDTGKPDEHKVMLGFDSMEEAKAAYASNYAPGWKGMKTISATPMAEFKQWLASGDTKKPFHQPTLAERAQTMRSARGAQAGDTNGNDRAPAGTPDGNGVAGSNQSVGSVEAGRRVRPDAGAGNSNPAGEPVARVSADRPDGAGRADDAVTDLPTLQRQWQEAAKSGDTARAKTINDRIVALKSAAKANEQDTQAGTRPEAAAASEAAPAASPAPSSARTEPARPAAAGSATVEPAGLKERAEAMKAKRAPVQNTPASELQGPAKAAAAARQLGTGSEASPRPDAYKQPAISAVSEYVAGDISKAALIERLSKLGMTEAQVGSVTYRLQDDFTAADIRKVLGNETAPDAPQSANSRSAPTPSKNTIFTDDAAAAARAILKKKLGTLNSGIDPELLQAGITLAGYHIEKGARSFAAYTAAMVEDLGDTIRPYLKSLYMAVKFDPRAAAFDGMSSSADVESASTDATTATKDAPNAAPALDQPSAKPLGGIPAEAVSGTQGQRETGQRATAGGGRDGAGDGHADRPGNAGGRGVGAGARDVPVSAARAGRGAGAGAERGVPVGAGAAPDAERLQRPVTPPEFARKDFKITADTRLGEGGQKTKFKQNVAAIRLLNDLEVTGRNATVDEQNTLARYVGWGGLPQAFDAGKEDWAKEHAELKDLLTPDEYAAAMESTQYAHYTSEPIIGGMYDALQRLGFKGGKVLEPGGGVGNFIGLMPDAVKTGTRVTLVERERIAAGIAKRLYPEQNVQLADFTAFKGTDGYFDAAIGNPPFSSTPLTDVSGRKHLSRLSVHNYFFAKSIDMLRPGGVLAQVVSNSFLDAGGDRARQYIGERTKLLGAIRLPNNAFSKNANTEVTTDIVFLQKLPESEWGTKEAKAASAAWMDLTTVPDPAGGEPIPVNRYFADHPEMMLGRMERTGTMYRADQPALKAREGQDTAALMKAAIAKLPEGAYVDSAVTNTAQMQDSLTQRMKDVEVEIGGFFHRDGKLYERVSDEAGESLVQEITPGMKWTEKTTLGEARFDRLRQLADLRTTMRALLAAEMSGENPMAMRNALGEQYDAYVKAHGLINDTTTIQVYGEDPDFPLLASLEHDYKRGISADAAKKQGIAPFKSSAKKSPIFTRPVVEARKRVMKAKTPADALAVSMAERGKIDADYMSELLGRKSDEILNELSDGAEPLLFKDPASNEFVLRDAYLSGNVRKKLEQAKAASMLGNVRALTDVQPEDVGVHDISVRVGSPWVPTQFYEDFAKEMFGEGTKARVSYLPMTSGFMTTITAGNDVANTNKWGTKAMSGTAILDALLNNRTIKVTHVDSEGKVYTDQPATEEANLKASEMKEKFQDWVFKDSDRAEAMGRAYNDENNNYVTRRYDGTMMTFPGKVPDEIIAFRRHQRDAIARIVQDRTALLDHVVGAGKTFTIVAGAMELKRTGLARKPMVAVPNHLVKQWAADWYRLYPGANILAATKKDFEKANRRRFLARIATGDWDAVIIAHSSFGFIQPEPEFEIAFNEKQIADIMETMNLVEQDGDPKDPKNKRRVKQLAKMQEGLEQRIKALRDRPMDSLLDFGQLGVDQLFVDEAHLYKNLMFSTKMQNVQGLGDGAGSQRAYDMYVKAGQIFAKNGRGQGLVFATGTPISNSLAEMYHMMRYLMPAQMEELGFQSFDAWANTYASVDQVWMQKISGDGFKAANRMATFVNTPELLKLFDQVADTVTMADIKKAYSEENKGAEFPLPKVKGGRRTPVSIEKSQAQTDYMTDIAARAKALEARKGPPKKGEDNALVIMTDARKAAMDVRLVKPDIIEREKGGRIDRASDEVVSRYKDYDAWKGAQLVFSDLGTPLKQAKAEMKEYEALKARADLLDDADLNASAQLGDKAAAAKLDDAQVASDELEAKGSDWLGAVKAALRGFSVYDDFRKALIEKGIPEHEIAFIHDYNTDDQKAALFRKVNSGQIRVLLGSTAKLGAGTNVQERLVAEHHLDVPWKPSDVEQREGRIERQGNKLMDEIPGFEVEILAYVTRDTLDMRMWQLQEAKLKMINQLRERKVGREVDNAFQDMEMSAGEMQAAATGNMDLLTEIKLKNDVKLLEQKQRAFDSQKADLATRRRRAEQVIDAAPKKIAQWQPWVKAWDEYRQTLQEDRAIDVTIDGKEFTSKDAASEALRAVVDAHQAKLDARTQALADAKESAAKQFPNKEDGVQAAARMEAAEAAAKANPMPKLSVEFNGKTYGSKVAVAEAFYDATGDSQRFDWNFDGRDFIHRAKLIQAIEDPVMDALETDTPREIGSFGPFKVSVEGQTSKTGGTKRLDVIVEHGSRVISDDVSAWKLAETKDAGKNNAANVIEKAQRLLANAESNVFYATEDMRRAKKALAELGDTQDAGDWPGSADLDKARAAHKEVLKRLATVPEKGAADAPALSLSQRVATMRKGTDKAGQRTEDIQGLVDMIAARWVNAPKIVVVDSIADERLPDSMRNFAKGLEDRRGGRSQGESGGDEGFFSNAGGGTVYLVADQLPGDAAVVRVLLHESLGHFGLRTVFGKQLGTILDQLADANESTVRAKAEQYGLNFDTTKGRRAAAEEVLAEMAQKTPENTWVQQAIAAIRTWLREHVPGFSTMKFSDAELVANFIVPARDFVKQGAAPATSTASSLAPVMLSRSIGETMRSLDQKEARNLFLDAVTSHKGLNMWQRTVGTQYDKAQKNPKTFGKVFNAVQDYIKDISVFANAAADMAPSILPKLDNWTDLAKGGLLSHGADRADLKAAGHAIFKGTLEDAKVYTDAELAAMKLTPKQIGLYREFRATVDQSLDDMGKTEIIRLGGKDADAIRPALLDAADMTEAASLLSQYLNEAAAERMDKSLSETAVLVGEKAAQVAKLKKEGYAPLMRFGRYTVNVTKDGEVKYFGMYESEFDANRAARELAADPQFKGAEVKQGVMSQEAFKLFSGLNLDSLELFAKATGNADNPVYQEYLKLTKNNRSAMKRMIHRQGIAGFSEDTARVLAAFVTSNSRMASGNLHLGTAKQAAEAIPKEQGDIKDEAVKLVDYVQNPQEEAAAMRGLLFTNFIGGSVASAMVNLTQPFTMTLPYLSQFGGIAKATGHLLAAAKTAAGGKAEGEIGEALARAERDGIVSPQEIHHLQAAAMNRASHPLLKKAAFVWGSLFSLSEQFNRRVTFIAAYNAALQQHIENPFAFAEKAVIETQGLYNKGNKANWARGAIGATVMTFKQFSTHYLEFLTRMYANGPEGKKAVAVALAILVLTAGAGGLPFADDLDDIIDTLAQAMGYDFSSKKAKRKFISDTLGFGDVAAELATRGLSSLPGMPIDLSLRMGMGNLLPGTGALLRSNTDRSKDVLEFAGAAGGLAKSVMDAGTKALGGDIAGAGMGLAPVAIQNMLKATQMWNTGEYRNQKGQKVMNADEADGAMKFIGFQPSAIARESSRMGEIQRSVQLAKNVEGEIAGKWAQAQNDGDVEGVRAARKELAEWNADNPGSPIAITNSQIAKRVMEMRASRIDRTIKAAPKELRERVKEGLT